MKSCPSTPRAKHFVDIDTSNYEIDNDLFEISKKKFQNSTDSVNFYTLISLIYNQT